MIMNIRTNKNGFSLNEIVVTVIIISVLTALALPQYTTVAEKARAAEARTSLASLLGAQKAYQLENSSFATDINELEVSVTPKNFFAPVLPVVNDPLTDPVATLTRDDPTYDYTIGVLENGDFICDEGSTSGICSKIGFP